MERLTKRIGAFVYYTKGKYEDTIPAECETQDVRNILSCLAAYEDTGLEPRRLSVSWTPTAGGCLCGRSPRSGWR